MTKFHFYNRRTKQLVIKFRNKFICIKISPYRVALPLYIAKHWSGLGVEKTKTSWHVYLLCLEFEFNYYGVIIEDKNWPWRT